MRLLLVCLLVSLGSSAHALLMVSPPSVNFFDVPVNSYGQTATVYVENESQETVQLTVMNECMEDFEVTNWCENQLLADQNCMIGIRFSPNLQGYQSCEIWVSDSVGESQNISVSGQGV